MLLNYISSATPDTANIIILSNDNSNIVVGTVLRVDDIEFVGGNVGIKEIYNSNSISISPNPFSTSATLVIARNGMTKQSLDNIQIVLYDVLGRKVEIASSAKSGIAMTANGKGEIKIERGNLKEGMYFYKLQTTNHEQLTTGKLIIANN